MTRTRFLLLLLWLGTFFKTPAASYYLSSSTGKDTHTPEDAQHPATPWQSLERLNQFIPQLSPGDSVLFKKGDLFFGTLHLKKSGTKEKPIVYSHYGNGPLPMITGLTELKGWKRHSPGIYFVELSPLSNRINMLTINGKPQAMGRFPNSDEKNKGYLVPEKVVGKNQLSHEIFLDNGGWKGAELALRKTHWIIDRHKITAQDGNTITFSSTSSYDPKEGFGFFIQNHLNTLDQFGEWYQDLDNDRLYVCLEEKSPEEVAIQIGELDQLLTTLPNTRHVVIDGLHLNGANKTGLFIRGGNALHFSNGIIENSGENGVLAYNMDHLTIRQSEIRNSFNNGIYLRSGNYQATIAGNLIENTYMMPGMGQNGDNNGFAFFSISDADTIVRNTIRNTGYVGIGFRGSHTLIKNNLVEGFCLTKGDGGGIYSYSGNSNTSYKDKIVSGNIVRNGYGAREGTPLQGTDLPAPAEGIYIDDNTNNVRVTDNTVYGISNKGIYLHNAQNIEISNNLVFDAGYLIHLADDDLGRSLRNISIASNTLIKKEPHQIGMGIRSGTPKYASIGLSDQNHFVDLSGAGISFHLQNLDTKEEMYFDSENWETTSGWEQSSTSRDLKAHLERSATSEKYHAEKTLSGGAIRERIVCTKGCNISWETEGGFSITGNSEKSEVKVNLSGLENEVGYALSLSLSSSKNAVMAIFLRQNGPTYRKLSASKILIPSTENQAFQLLFDRPDERSTPALLLTLFQGNNTTRITEFLISSIKQAHEPSRLKNFKLLTNPTGHSEIIDLEAEWQDLLGTSYSTSLTLAPFQSLFLIRK
ncbi:right-handed parallel beta-helix repeat-containing protein [Cyclobacterium roseum]|uniref:right-handed parallel beta-helix repeat-containing protein n=1 Tax=Cyclobacterium roseum TaxID=2666137 RepID=UPI00139164AC|nr:right-handed parallel beta-helix repeat-containing protein [Cyclobacterium roseum]